MVAYVGGKSRQRRDFVPVILRETPNRDEYLEPFVGGGWMLEKMAPHFQSVIASDIHEDLVLMWQDALAGKEFPSSVTEESYYKIKGSEPSGLRGFVGFGCSFGGKWFGGYARRSGSTAGTYPRRAGNHIKKTVESMPTNAGFVLCSYTDHAPGPGTVVYADPPYSTRGVEYKDSSGFDHQEFWRVMDSWVVAGAHVFVSEFHAPAHWEPLVVSNQTLTLSSNAPGTSRKQGTQLDTLWAPRNRSYNPENRVTVPGNRVRPGPSQAVVIRLLDRPDYDPDKIAALIRDEDEGLL